MKPYAETYRRLCDEELNDLFDDFDNLEPDAQLWLTAAANERGWSESSLELLIDAGRKRKTSLEYIEGANRQLTSAIGSVTNYRGCGRVFYGKSNLYTSPEFWYEEFDTTLWWVLFFVPLIPRGSYRIRRKVF